MELVNNVNMKAFPSIGAFPNEVGSGVSPGGIGGPWLFNLPLQYYFQGFGQRRKSSRRAKRAKRSKVSRRSRKRAKVSRRSRKRAKVSRRSRKRSKA